MLRLRTSTALSLLALAIGVVGTGWLSTLTSRGPGISAHRARAASATAQVHRMAPNRVDASGARARSDHPSHGIAVAFRRTAPDDTFATPAPTTPALRPVSMPGDTSQPWYQLVGHMDGRVVAHVDVDGSGHVIAASVVESSGDPLLDEHALRSVRGWRFAVPADQPNGISGDLPMRFSSAGDRVARLP